MCACTFIGCFRKSRQRRFNASFLTPIDTEDRLIDLAVKLSKASSMTTSYEDSLIIKAEYDKVCLYHMSIHYMCMLYVLYHTFIASYIVSCHDGHRHRR